MMKRLRSLVLLPALCGGLLATTAAQTALPPPPPLPPPAYGPPSSAGAAEGQREPGAEGRRGNWRNLSPEQREAIRRLSQEERQALANRNRSRNGEAPAPGGRLSVEERRQLRAQIREEHERRGLRGGGAKRP